MAKYFDLTGKEISKERFLEQYNEYYYTGIKDNRSGIRVKANPCLAEKIVENILYSGLEKKKDVKDVLAWKLGRIDAEKTKQKGVIAYRDNWILENSKARSCRRLQFNIERVSKIVLELFIENKKSPIGEQAILDILKEQFRQEDGIGTTYMITLLYFIKKGKYPIYDQYAYRAVQAIKDEIKPGSKVISPLNLPSRKDDSFMNTTKKLSPYVNCIKCLFGSDYDNSRDWDRALWVYGHLFTKVYN